MVEASKHRPYRIHQNDLPPVPTKWDQLDDHPYGLDFKIAVKAEIDTLKKKNTWVEVPFQSNVKPIPLKWVLTYKFDDNGYLLKIPARLCAGGDLVPKQHPMDTRSTTLASKSFRLMMALVAAFDLDAIQLDAVNAYLNAEIPKEQGKIYAHCTLGFAKSGIILFLKRALYGLSPAGLLLQQYIIYKLENLGLKQVQEDGRLFTDGIVILFYYVDDFVIIARKEDRSYLEERR